MLSFVVVFCMLNDVLSVTISPTNGDQNIIPYMSVDPRGVNGFTHNWWKINQNQNNALYSWYVNIIIQLFHTTHYLIVLLFEMTSFITNYSKHITNIVQAILDGIDS